MQRFGAIISIPADAALEAAEECGKKGVRGLIVIAAGFREIGPVGVRVHEAIKAALDPNNILNPGKMMDWEGSIVRMLRYPCPRYEH